MPGGNRVAPVRGPYSANQTDWNNAAVREHICRLARVAEATASAVVITDLSGVIVWVNDGFTRISGYSFEEAVGRVPGRLLQGPDTDREQTARIGAALRSKQGIAGELINYGKTGRRYWVGMKIEPLLDAAGEVDGFMAIEAEITERHERNQALEQLTARFNLATHAAHIGMYEFNAAFDEVWWNEVMWEIFGQDPLSFRPSLEGWLDRVHPDDRDRVRDNNGSRGLGRPSASLDYRILRPDGTVRHVQSIAATGDEVGLAGALLDVTERVEAVERERKLQLQLRASSHHAGMAEIATGVLHNVGNILNSLGIANTTASRDVKALRVDRFAQATDTLRAHRSTLASFLSDDERGKFLPDYLSALAAQLTSNVRAVQAELETTERLLDHLRDIVSAQQVLARVGGLRESIDLTKLVESALLVQASDLAHIEVVRKFDEVPSIMVDGHKLLQVLVNLISNASDAIRANPDKTGRLLVQITQKDDHARVTIEDSGIGMSPETLANIWQFGFTTKPDGHGFGLHNSANAAHEIGATLSAHSDGPGRGARFTLQLPVVDCECLTAEVAA